MRSHLRREGKVDREERRRVFEGKSVLVTGAGGSIGSQLCHQICSDNARKLTMVSLTEAGLYNIERRLVRNYAKYRDTRLVPILGSYGDYALMGEVLDGVDLIVHAGAHKHVPMCESNPLEAIRNNVVSTMYLMHAAMKAEVKQFCAISSDKAVAPTSVMGATKRVVELMCHALTAMGPTKFFVVRFGNVCDSAGSVLPLWREQIADGGPITLTDERCERYFMSIAQAVDLIASVISMRPDKGVFVLDMGQPKRLIDIARMMIKEAGKRVEIKITGLRPGEKVTEQLHFGGALVATRDPMVSIVSDAHPPIDMHAVDRLIDLIAHRSTEAALHTLWEIAR